MSGQLLFLLVSYIDIICGVMNEQEILAHVVNLMFKCFDCKVPQIQLVCIEKAYALCQKVSFNDMKTKLIPRILMLCNDPDVKVKKRALKFVKERIDLLDPSLVQSQAFSIIENNLGQNNPASINFLILDLMEEISKSYDVDLIASKILPILIGFLANKTSTKDEFDRYHESVLKFINRVKDKRMKEFSTQPFKAKPEEPDDAAITIQPLDSLVNNTKVDGLDTLFAKQNQFGHSHGMPSPSPPQNNSQSNNAFQFPDLTTGLETSNQGNMGMTFGNDFNFGTPTASTPSTDINKGSPFPKPPEKAPHENLGTSLGQPQVKKPLNFGSLTGISLGSESKLTQPKKGPANYSALDDLAFSGLGNSGGLGSENKPTSTLGNSGGFGNTLGNSGGLGSTINSYSMGGSNLMGSGPKNDFNITFGGSLNNGMGIGGLSINDPNDPFQRGMDGLMMGGLGSQNGGGFGMGSSFGGVSGSLGTGSSTGTGQFGGQGMGMTFGKPDMGSGMGGFNTFGGGSGIGSSGMNLMDLHMNNQSNLSFGGNNMLGNQPKPQTGGILSNPNLTFKAKEPEKKNPNNFNDFDLL